MLIGSGSGVKVQAAVGLRTLIFRCWSALVALAVSLNVISHHGTIDSPSIAAATPPMGWNSYDGYGTTINEGQFKANAEWFAKQLKLYGWRTL